MKYSIHIGINYTKTPIALMGCVNDCIDMFYLVDQHIKGYESFIIEEANATKEHILLMIGLICDKAKKEDFILITNSSHGTMVQDRDGDEPIDEAMVPYDYMDNLILDDELAEVFSRTQASILLISDSCHSETMHRAHHQPLGTYRQARSVRLDTTPTAKKKKYKRNPRVACMSGCSATGSSYDAIIDGRANGAYTRTLISTYKKGMSIAQWHASLKGKLPSAIYQQTPTLTGSYAVRKIVL
jgi:hypothetical protein